MNQYPSKGHKLQLSSPSSEIYLTNVKLISFSRTGELSQSLATPHLKHDSNKKVNTIKKPIIKIIKNQQPWIIKADQAVMTSENKKVMLIGNVSITEFSEGQILSKLTTNKLYYYPNKNKVYTNQTVQYQKKGLIFSAKGLKANLESEKVQLLSKIRGIYDPKVG